VELYSSLLRKRIKTSLLVDHACSKWSNDLLKRDRVCPNSQGDAVILAAARVEHQGWPEARNARAGGVYLWICFINC